MSAPSCGGAQSLTARCSVPTVGALSGRSPRLGKDGRIRHVEYVKEFMDEPDYARLIEAAKRAAAE